MMKKYLMTGIAALTLCATFTSCSRDLGPMSQEEIDAMNAQKVTRTYETAFLNYVGGHISENQDWGFGAGYSIRTRAGENGQTHAEQSQKWTEVPKAHTPTTSTQVAAREVTMPTYTHTVADAVYANDVTNWDTQKIISIDGNYTTFQQKDEQVIYVIDNAKYYAGVSNNGNGTLFIVKSGKTLQLGCVGHNMQVYLEENATLDVSNWLDWEGKPTPTTTYTPFIFEKSKAAIYMNSGSKIVGSDVHFFDGCKVLNDGGTIEITNLSVDKNAILWNKGSFNNVTNLSVNNENALVYNAAGKTLNVTNIKMDNNSALLYNDGTVKVTGGIEYYNTNAEIVNSGKLEAPFIDFKAGGLFYNDDKCETIIHGTTTITNTNSKWWNNGDYKSGDFVIYNAIQVVNSCKLTVAADAAGSTGTFTYYGDAQTSFVLNGGNSVKTTNMVWGSNANMYFGANSLLWVTNKLNAICDVTGSGAYGPTTGYGIIKAGEIAYDNSKTWHRWSINYYGNIFVDTDNHFPQGNDDGKTVDTAQPWYYYSTNNKTVKFKFAPYNDACPITSTIAAGDCYHGYTPPTTPPTTDDTNANLRVIAEDLSASDDTDFDFNDIVFDVYFGSPAKIKVICAGGTLPLRIRTGGTADDRSDWTYTEVHSLYGQPTSIMINTGAEAKYPNMGKDGLGEREVTLGYAVGNNADAKNIVIEVQKTLNGKTQWVEMKADKGQPAAKLAVGTDFTPLGERQSIKGVYNKFVDWAQSGINSKWW